MALRIIRQAAKVGVLTTLALSISFAGGTVANAAPTGSSSAGAVQRAESIPLTQAGAELAAAPATCTNTTYGGTFYCGYGSYLVVLSTGVRQFFAVGTDYAVWTRWLRTDGTLSSWTSLGGTVNSTVSTSNFVVCYPLNLHVNVKGTNGQYYYKTRIESSGTWSSSWQLGVPCFA